MAESGPRKIMISFQMDEGDPLGATPDEKLVLVRIQNQTLADGRFQLGDQILTVNGKKVNDRNHFYKLLSRANPNANIEVLRYDQAAQNAQCPAVSADAQIPINREKFIQRHAGFIYMLVKVEILRGKKLGLGIRDIQNRVLVSKVDPNTLAHGKLQVRDHIIDIDGTRVSDKEIARELIIKSMRAQGYFTCIVGRPVTEEAKKACDLDLSVRSEPPSIRMNDDVREIAAREQAEIRAKNDQPRPRAISTPETQQAPRNVYFDAQSNREHTIGNDNIGKDLRPVRK